MTSEDGEAGVMAKPWTEKHQREALRRTYEIAAEMAGAGEPGAAWGFCPPSLDTNIVATAEFWADWLSGLGLKGKRILDDARVDREVRRVRELAEGRLVRETFPAVRIDGVAYRRRDMASARASAVDWNKDPAHFGVRRARAVRITRIRRVPS